MQQHLLFAAGLICLFLVKKCIEYRRAIRAIHNYPGVRAVLSNSSGLGYLCKRSIPGLAVGGARLWVKRYSDFCRYGADIVSCVAVLPRTEILLFVADPAAIKEISSDKTRFSKPTELYELVNIFGRNIVTTEGDEWKRHRKIVAPAFSERNCELVWEETLHVMIGLFNDVWGSDSIITLDNAFDITMPISLFVVAASAFGRRIPWTEGGLAPPGHHMSFKEALHIVSTGTVIKAVLPKWLLNLGPSQYIREVRDAFREMEAYMREMVTENMLDDTKSRRDLFSSLVHAGQDSPGQEALLTDAELLGNVFMFLLAGHETAASTLCFALGLLALHKDEQDKLYDHIRFTLGEKDVPAYSDLNSLSYCSAVLYETLRLFPPVIGIPKKATEDTVLSTVDRDGNPIAVPVPVGSSVAIHVPGVHYNPRYWKDPAAFRPSRFFGNWPRDAFLPFGAGSRACIGRRFFETEAITALTMLVMRYEISVTDEPQFRDETAEQRRERVLSATQELTLT
uniref:Cytochrome P450 n=1 Tax=Phanerodontia chrysosporium TaxID=2822231 RepID=G5EJS7_PHACH|nr:cytochrome P450 [Phanerodontia chrysosporium]